MMANLQPIVTFADAPDGWRLATYRYPPRSRKKNHPVILVHGMATNRHDMDFPLPHLSIAKFLHRHGYDTWVIELRGTGLSHKRGLLSRRLAKFTAPWTFDDHIDKDIPALVEYIQKATRKKKFHWAGHSLGGTVVYCAIETLGNDVCASAATLGSAMSASAKIGFIKMLLKIDPAVKKIPFLPLKHLAQMVAPLGRWVAPLEDNFFYAIDNVDLKMIDLALKVAVENVSSPLFLQMHTWYKTNHFRSADGSFSYRDHLKDIRAPFFVGAGSVDGLTALPDVRFAYDRISSKEKKFRIFGRAQGCRTEYGHLDLALGKNAPREVYPAIAEWFDEHD